VGRWVVQEKGAVSRWGLQAAVGLFRVMDDLQGFFYTRSVGLRVIRRAEVIC